MKEHTTTRPDGSIHRPARPLAERLRSTADATPADPALVRSRCELIRQWRTAAPFGPDGPARTHDDATPRSTLTGPQLWQRRLAAINLDDDGLLAALLADDAEDARNAGETGAVDGPPDEPTWVADLVTAWDQHRHHDEGRRLCAQLDPDSLLVAVEPLIGWAARELFTRVHRSVSGYTDRPMIRPQDAGPLTDRMLLHGLLPRLERMVQRTLLADLQRRRESEELPGGTPHNRFRSFRALLRDPRQQCRLLAGHPVLGRQLALTARDWIDHAVELVERLRRDTADLTDVLGGGRELGWVDDIDTDLGDPHRGARTVCVVRFSSGLRVVYKPRPMAVDVHFQRLLEWVNERTTGPRYRVLRCLDRGGYGWMEHVAARPCQQPAELTRFFHREGGLLALLYLVHAGDFHAGNLIAAGDQPVLVDLETLFNPRLTTLHPVDESAAERAAADLISGSVLRAGLLPSGGAQWAGGAGSGIGAAADRPVPTAVRLPQLVGAGTDRMRVRLEPGTVGGQHSRPVAAGTDLRLDDHADELLAGFTEMYRLLLRHRAELAADDGPLAAFAADQVRVVVRDTMTYGMLLGMSFHPAVLADGLARERIFDWLWREVARRPGLGVCVEAERRDLWRNDIPVFTARAGGDELYDSIGAPVPGCRLDSGLGLAREILDRLGEPDLERQLWLVRMCLATNDARWHQRLVFERHRNQPAPEPVDRDRLAAAVQAVADRLVAVAVTDGEEALWYGADMGTNHSWRVGVLGPSLYDGNLGIALFLAQHAEVSGDPRAGRLARAAVRAAVRQLRRGQLGPNPGLAGRGGAVYALAQLGARWADDALLAQASEVAASCRDLLGTDTQYAVMEGSAGAVFGLAALHAVRPRGDLLDLIRLAADRLLATQRPAGGGAAWLPDLFVQLGISNRPLAGFAHGAAGIASALHTATELLGDDRYTAAVRAALDYERALFEPATGHWRDLRSMPGVDVVRVESPDGGPGRRDRAVAWCHGAPGIGISRLHTARHLDDPAVQADLDRARSAAIADGFGNGHSLCHGDAGVLDFLLLAADQTGDAELLTRVYRHTGTVLDTIDATGWSCGLHRNLELPGLFNGLAGIGHGLLRVLTGGAVPSVLAQQPPRP